MSVHCIQLQLNFFNSLHSMTTEAGAQACGSPIETRWLQWLVICGRLTRTIYLPDVPPTSVSTATLGYAGSLENEFLESAGARLSQQNGCPVCCPTNSIKAPKGNQVERLIHKKWITWTPIKNLVKSSAKILFRGQFTSPKGHRSTGSH